jgi:hypothetical protein
LSHEESRLKGGWKKEETERGRGRKRVKNEKKLK